MNIFKYIRRSWKIYKYRFVPWLKLNVQSQKFMTVVQEKVISDKDALMQIIKIFSCLNQSNQINAHDSFRQVAGFLLNRQASSISGAGTGVFITSGIAKKGQVVAIYPGTVYLPSDFIFFQSILNQFVFCCSDHIHIDGKDTGLSKLIFKSCSHRDKIGMLSSSDMSWLGKTLVCPLNLGQYVNNKTNDKKANVQYQELNIMKDFPLELRKFIPNVNVNGLHSLNFLRVVILVALEDIPAGNELLSDYFTVTHL